MYIDITCFFPVPPSFFSYIISGKEIFWKPICIPAKERKFAVFESKLNELFQKECCLWGERENDKTAHYWYCNFSCYRLQLQSAI